MIDLSYPYDWREVIRNKIKYKKQLLSEKCDFLKKRIAILSGSTVGELKDVLELFLLNQGIEPEFYEGSYGRFFEDAVFENPSLDKFQPDLIYIHTSVKNIDFPRVKTSESEVESFLEQTISRFEKIWQELEKKYSCPIIQNNVEELPYRLFGNTEAVHKNGWIRFVWKLNEIFSEYARTHSNFFIDDIHWQSACVGFERWFDDKLWYLYKYPFSLEASCSVAFNLSNIVKSLYGKNKKALICDLDNTLWGGVIGDDGAENIRLSREEPSGMPYRDLQKVLLNLFDMGVMLNVCSKNDEDKARAGLKHPNSVLQEDNFIYFVANWENKDLNISSIIKSLNIMPDAAVFLDDNPVERELVKVGNPDVEIPVFDRPENYVKTLLNASYFEVTGLSDEDKKRNSYYISDKKRKFAKADFTDYESYLKSLKMKTTIRQVNEKNLGRFVQLVNKTNQFNMTGIRITEEELRKMLNSSENIVLTADLSDKFGDNGIVSCLFAKKTTEAIQIINWVMSCRVFKRDLEKAVFDYLVDRCFKSKLKEIRGEVVKTKKNAFCQSIYSELGFSLSESSMWIYEIGETYTPKNTVMEVEYE